MKTIYLVRHGESVVNTSDSYLEGNEFPLTEKGKEQARLIAERASRLEFDTLITSTMQRTRETAEFITQSTGKQPEETSLIVERRFPSALIGRSKTDPEARQLMAVFNHSLEHGGPRVGDGETFDELKERADKTIEYFEHHRSDSLLVVTHGYFLRVLMARVIVGPDLTADSFRPFAWGMRTKNTGLSVLRFDPNDNRGRPWHMLVWNDHAHLG